MVHSVLINGVASLSANPYPDKFITVKFDMRSPVGLSLILVPIIFIKLSRFSTSLPTAVMLTIFLAFGVIAGIGTLILYYYYSGCV